MKFKINSKRLANALNKVASVIERRNTIPILSNVYVSASTDGIHIEGTDLDTVCRVHISDVVVQQDGEATINAAKLTDSIKRLPDGDCDIEVKDGHAVVKQKRSRFKIATLDASDWPVQKFGEFRQLATVDGEYLKDVNAKVGYCVSQEEARYYLQGVNWCLVDGKVVNIATDGHRLSKIVTGLEYDGELNIIVPRKATAESAKLDGSVKVEFNGSAIRFTSDDTVLTSKLIDGTFPDWQRVIPQGNDKLVTIDAASLAGAVGRVQAVQDGVGSGIKVRIRGNELTLSLKTQLDEADETFDVESNIELDIGVNYKYLSEAMSKFDGDVTSRFSDGNYPMIFEKDNYLSLIMPMRV